MVERLWISLREWINVSDTRLPTARLALVARSELGLIFRLEELPELLIKEGRMLDHGGVSAVGEKEQLRLTDFLFEERSILGRGDVVFGAPQDEGGLAD